MTTPSRHGRVSGSGSSARAPRPHLPRSPTSSTDFAEEFVRPAALRGVYRPSERGMPDDAERPCPTAPPHATTPGPKAASAEPRRPRSVPFMRVMLHTSLPGAPGTKGLMAVASIECPEDRSFPRLRFRQGATTLAVLVLDGKSIRVSLVAGPCSDARGGGRGGGPSCATQWLKLTCEGGGIRRGDLYAYAAMGWRALLPHLYA